LHATSIIVLYIVHQSELQVGPNIHVFYKDNGGVIATHGIGCYLIDSNGTRYLDTCNNVACVGHSHPTVVSRGQVALSEIQTNQRFLHPIQQKYLSKLLKTFPPELNTVYLVNSGSEANDLALRMAQSHTSASRPNDVIVLDNAYHGRTIIPLFAFHIYIIALIFSRTHMCSY
jgi:4-aminobutyrate aminotransferase-like enzyme